MKNIQDILQTDTKTLLDVRTKSEYDTHHIKDAVNIPLNELPNRLKEVQEFETPIIVYCLSGGRSSSAYSFLQQSNIKEVYNGGGIGTLEMMMLPTTLS